VVGVGAGQQSRVDCVKLAGRKVDTWHARFHPKVRALKFKESVKVRKRVGVRVLRRVFALRAFLLCPLLLRECCRNAVDTYCVANGSFLPR
jgi:AICAR transformylase/IMP cyclohydrolase PurH